MADTFDSETRSWIMSRVRSVNTRPELLVRSALHAAGFRFRLHRRDLPGTPDIVLPKHRAAVFVQGCFWHGHECARFRWPKSNVAYWRNKIKRNKARDARTQDELRRCGWNAYVVWTCDIEHYLAELLKALSNAAAPPAG